MPTQLKGLWRFIWHVTLYLPTFISSTTGYIILFGNLIRLYQIRLLPVLITMKIKNTVVIWYTNMSDFNDFMKGWFIQQWKHRNAFTMAYHVTTPWYKMKKMKWPNYNTNVIGVFALWGLRSEFLYALLFEKQSYHYDSNLSFVCSRPIKRLLSAITLVKITSNKITT